MKSKNWWWPIVVMIGMLAVASTIAVLIVILKIF